VLEQTVKIQVLLVS